LIPVAVDVAAMLFLCCPAFLLVGCWGSSSKVGIIVSRRLLVGLKQRGYRRKWLP
jgi:hypothetical protein